MWHICERLGILLSRFILRLWVIHALICSATLAAAGGNDSEGSSSEGSISDECDSSGGGIGRRLGGGPDWWCTFDEYSFMECFMVVSLIFLAIFFDIVHHFLHKCVSHDAYTHIRKTIANQHQAGAAPKGGGRRGTQRAKNVAKSVMKHNDGGVMMDSHSKSANQVHGEIDLTSRQKRLSNKLLNRAADELSVLGFIAFVIWILRNAELFGLVSDALPDRDDAGWRFPKTDMDLVHMYENVHMHLFIALNIFYGIILHAARGADFVFDLWHDLEVQLAERRRRGDSRLSQGSQNSRISEGITEVADRFGHAAAGYAHLYNAMRDYLLENSEDLLDGDKTLVDYFNFSLYLQVNTRSSIDDLINFHPVTWFFILVVILGVLAPLIRLGLNLNKYFLAVLLFGILGILLAMWKEIRAIKLGPSLTEKLHLSSLGSSSISPAPEKDADAEQYVSSSSVQPTGLFGKFQHWFYNDFNSELWVLRALQALLMMVSYGFAQTIGSKWYWTNMPYVSCFMLMLFLILYLGTWWALHHIVPWYLAVMATPPYMDPANTAVALAILGSARRQRILAGGADPYSNRMSAFDRNSVVPTGAVRFEAGGKTTDDNGDDHRACKFQTDAIEMVSDDGQDVPQSSNGNAKAKGRPKAKLCLD